MYLYDCGRMSAITATVAQLQTCLFHCHKEAVPQHSRFQLGRYPSVCASVNRGVLSSNYAAYSHVIAAQAIAPSSSRRQLTVEQSTHISLPLRLPTFARYCLFSTRTFRSLPTLFSHRPLVCSTVANECQQPQCGPQSWLPFWV
jgi:hypothetical protein